MTEYLFYFHYWYTEEELTIALNFDPEQKASDLLHDLNDELNIHIGEDEEPSGSNYQLLELYGLRPYGDVWQLPLEDFVAKYGHEFVVIDLSKPTLGLLESIRPKVIAGTRPRDLLKIKTTDPEWTQRSKLELRLVSALVRWLQFSQKRNWLGVVPIDAASLEHRIWQIETIIPDSDSYKALWAAILPLEYPTKPPALFIRAKDRWLIRNLDLSQRWKSASGEEYYYVAQLNAITAGWNAQMFVADWLLAGFWNFFGRELTYTFANLHQYQQLVSSKDFSTILPPFNTSPVKPSDLPLYETSGRFFTWFIKRIPEKGNEVVLELLQNFPEHETFAFIEWRYILDSITIIVAEAFSRYIYNYYMDLIQKKVVIYTDEMQSLSNFLNEVNLDAAKNIYKKLIEILKSYKCNKVQYVIVDKF